MKDGSSLKGRIKVCFKLFSAPIMGGVCDPSEVIFFSYERVMFMCVTEAFFDWILHLF